MNFIKNCEKTLKEFLKEFLRFHVFLEVSSFNAVQKIFYGCYTNKLGICKVA